MATDLSFRQDELSEDRSVIIVDDDRLFLERLARAMETRSFVVRCAGLVAEAMTLIHNSPPPFAIVGIRLGKGNGVGVIAELSRVRPTAGHHAHRL